MKKALLFFVIVLLTAVSAFSQTATLSYQAVVRDSHNKVVPDTDIPVAVSVSVGGTEKYYETRTAHTNRNGVVSFSIGGEGRTWPVAGHPAEDLSSVTGWNNATISVTFQLSGGDVTTSSPVSAVPFALEVANVDMGEYLTIDGLCDSIEHNCTNVPLKNAANEFTGTNVVPRGFDLLSTNEGNCDNIVVNACDLFAVFDSLNRKMNDILRTIDTLRNVNDSLAEMLQEVMPHLAITGPGSVGYCGGTNIVTFTATLTNANAEDYTYSWLLNGTAQSSTGSTMTFTPDAAGTYKVVCTATRSGHTTLKDSTTLSVTNGGDMPVFGLCQEGRTVTVKYTESLLTTTVAWGDGTESVVTAGDSHEYASAGDYTLFVTSTAYGNCTLSWPITITETTLHPCTVATAHTNTTKYSSTTGGLETVENGRVVSVQDQDGHSYYVTQIGNQCWMRSNLRTSKYNDGTAIPGGANFSSWSITEPYHYINPSYDAAETGYFYNWPAASKKICPKGWHVPSQEDWATMLSAAGVSTPASTGTGAVYLAGGCDWEDVTNGVSSQNPNSYENPDRDKWGFTAIPAGRNIGSTFVGYSQDVYFWTSTEENADHAKTVYMGNYTGVGNNGLGKEEGRLVRCVRSEEGSDDPSLSLTASPDDETVLLCGTNIHTVTYTATIENDDASGYMFSWIVNGSPASEAETSISRSWGNTGNHTVVCVATNGSITLKDTVTISVTIGIIPEIDGVNVNAQTVRLELPVGHDVDSVAWGDNTGEKVPQNIGQVYHTYQTGGNYTVTTYSAQGCTVTTNVSVAGGGTVIDAPDVTTGAASDIAQTSATLNGTVEANGNTITAQGFEWKVTEGGSYAQVSASGATMMYSLTGLTAGTSYTYRAFATTSEGTEYGSEVEFTTEAGSVTPPTPTDCGTVTDASGNTYNTVVIGSQCWMKENLRTTKYNGGTDIANYYDYSTSGILLERRGYLYDWNTVMNQSGDHDICPSGWHVPSEDEWDALLDFLRNHDEYICDNNSDNIAKALAATTDWESTNYNCDPGNNLEGNNGSGFSAIPSGYYDGDYNDATYFFYFWASTYDDLNDEGVSIDQWSSEVDLYSHDVNEGLSVRCVRDAGTGSGGGSSTITAPTGSLTASAPAGQGKINVIVSNLDFKEPGTGTVTVYYSVFTGDPNGRNWQQYGSTSNSIATGETFNATLTLEEDVYFIKVILDNGSTTEYEASGSYDVY